MQAGIWTASHVLCDCEAVATLRYRHLGHHLMKSGNFEDISVSKILHFVQGAGMLNEWAQELHKTSNTVKWWLPTRFQFYSRCERTPNKCVSTLQYVKHNAVMLPLNWKSITNFFLQDVLHSKRYVIREQMQTWKILWITLLLHYYMILSHKTNSHLSPWGRLHTLLEGSTAVLWDVLGSLSRTMLVFGSWDSVPAGVCWDGKKYTVERRKENWTLCSEVPSLISQGLFIMQDKQLKIQWKISNKHFI